MKELIAVRQQSIGQQEIKTVNARELHSFLEVKKDFSDWIKDRINKYGFTENQDYVCSPVLGSEGRGGQNRIDYHLTLDMAKELSMVERNEKGKEARLYFLECERVANQPQPAYTLPTNFKEALLQLVEQVEINEQLQLTITEQAPLVQLATAITSSPKSIRIGDYVKVISSQTGFIIGRNNFYEWLRFERILKKDNMPFQDFIDNGWFEVRESTYEHKNTNGPQVCFTTLITGKGQVSVLSRFKKSEYFQKFLNKSARVNSLNNAVPATA